MFRERFEKLAFDVYAAQQKWRLLDFTLKSEQEIIQYIKNELGPIVAVTNLPVLYKIQKLLREYPKESEGHRIRVAKEILDVASKKKSLVTRLIADMPFELVKLKNFLDGVFGIKEERKVV